MPFQSDRFEMQKKLSSEVEMLRIHARLERVRLSLTLKDIVEFCKKNADSDVLLYPVKENPFKEKKSCAIL